MYKEEYDDCNSVQGRFQQYFVHGDSADCPRWKRDYDNCVRFEQSPDNNLAAAQEIIDSESSRRAARWKGHYGNTVWEKRKSPPEDWAKPLPEWLQKRNENTYLDIKSKEMNSSGGNAFDLETKDRTLCVVM